MLRMKSFRCLVAAACLTLATSALADTTVSMNVVAENGVGESAGTVTISENQYGLLFTPNLHGLTPGAHGLHVHQNPSCDQGGMAAGGHFDPNTTGKHLGPFNDDGHLGDLPILFVDTDGTATLPVLAPRLHHLHEVNQHALMVHNGGDNYSDNPQKLGGGGARMVCGVIK